jgi:hypothetical protein
MSLLNFARSDWKLILGSKKDFSVDITITRPETGETALVVGLNTKHWFKVDYETGMIVNTRNAHINISEAELIAAYFPTRNAAGEINIKGCLIRVADSTGIEKDYVITQSHPDETVGVLVCLLGDYKPINGRP